MPGTLQTYRGFIREDSYGEDDCALLLSDDILPLARRIADDLDYHGRYATVRYWITEREMFAEELNDNLARIAVGAIDADYSQAYSEYTGYLWTDEDLKIGGHDLLDELRCHLGKFAHIDVEYHIEPLESDDRSD